MDLADCQSQLASACNALHDAPTRLAKCLLTVQDQTGTSRLMLTQEDLSVLLGVQRTTVTSVAAAMKTGGLITYSRGVIFIIDRAALEAMACKCYWAGRANLTEMTRPPALTRRLCEYPEGAGPSGDLGARHLLSRPDARRVIHEPG